MARVVDKFSKKPATGTANEQGQCVDLYIPRKCEWTNRIIYARDISSSTIQVATVDETGKKNGTVTVSLSGFVRQSGRGPEALELILKKRGIFPFAK